LQALNLWVQQYQFKALTTFQDEMLIVRKSSLSLFRNIEEELYREEHLSSEDLAIIEPEYLRLIRFQNVNEDKAY
jgi:hypothetical protein